MACVCALVHTSIALSYFKSGGIAMLKLRILGFTCSCPLMDRTLSDWRGFQKLSVLHCQPRLLQGRSRDSRVHGRCPGAPSKWSATKRRVELGKASVDDMIDGCGSQAVCLLGVSFL